jgi:hypothetical protein
MFTVRSQKQDIRETDDSGREDFIYVHMNAHARNITFLFVTKIRVTSLPSALRLAQRRVMRIRWIRSLAGYSKNKLLESKKRPGKGC